MSVSNNRATASTFCARRRPQLRHRSNRLRGVRVAGAWPFMAQDLLILSRKCNSGKKTGMAGNVDVRPQLNQSGTRLEWEMRYEGLLAVAVIDGVAWAGISGPWPDGHFALTWWGTSACSGAVAMEFYSTMAAARTRVANSLVNAVAPPRGMRCVTSHELAAEYASF